jgi:hypothetical protein
LQNPTLFVVNSQKNFKNFSNFFNFSLDFIGPSNMIKLNIKRQKSIVGDGAEKVLHLFSGFFFSVISPVRTSILMLGVSKMFVQTTLEEE